MHDGHVAGKTTTKRTEKVVYVQGIEFRQGVVPALHAGQRRGEVQVLHLWSTATDPLSAGVLDGLRVTVI